MKCTWLRETITDSRTKKASAKRVVMLMAGFAFSVSVVILSVSTLCGFSASGELAAVSAALAGLAGYGYVNGKLAERQTSREP